MDTSRIHKHVTIVTLVVIVVISAIAAIVWKTSEITPDQFSSGIQTAESSFNIGDINLSITELENLLTKNLDVAARVDVAVALASAYAQKGSLEFKEVEYGTKAVTLLQEILALDSQNSNIYRVMAYAYEIMQNYPAAVTNYEKSLELNMNNAMAHSGLGHAYDLMGDIQRAEFHLREAVRLDPTLDHALYNIAKISFSTQKFTDAKKFAEQTIAISKNKRFISEATSLLGLLEMREMKYTEAVALFEKALNVDATLVHNYVFLADAKLSLFNSTSNVFSADFKEQQQKAFSEVLLLLDKAHTINQNYTGIYLVQARIDFVKRDKSAVMLTLQKAASLVDSDITLGAQEKLDMKVYINNLTQNYSNII